MEYLLSAMVKGMPAKLLRRLVYRRGEYFYLCIIRLGIRLFRAELATGCPQVVAQFTFRIVLSVALTTGGLSHLLSPPCL